MGNQCSSLADFLTSREPRILQMPSRMTRKQARSWRMPFGTYYQGLTLSQIENHVGTDVLCVLYRDVIASGPNPGTWEHEFAEAFEILLEADKEKTVRESKVAKVRERLHNPAGVTAKVIADHAAANPMSCGMEPELDRVAAVLRSTSILWNHTPFYMKWDNLANIAGVPRKGIYHLVQKLIGMELVEIIQYGQYHPDPAKSRATIWEWTGEVIPINEEQP
jgi:hypothetical protein